MNFVLDTKWRLAMSGAAEAIQAAGGKSICCLWAGPARLRLNQARSAGVSTGRARLH